MATRIQTAGVFRGETTPRRRLRRAKLYRDAGDARRAPLLPRLVRLTAALLIASVVATAAAFAYLYTHYSKVVDERLAAGYLTSRAGLYAAPRTLREGQRLTAAGLADVLRRAGYVEGEASRVWNGSFRVEADAVEIFPSEDSAGAGAQGVSAVRVEFDRGGHVSGLRGDGAPLDFFTLAPEPLTVEAGEKTAERSALSYAEIPEVLRRGVHNIAVASRTGASSNTARWTRGASRAPPSAGATTRRG
jgi:penicillin-binding protein 1B